MMQKEEHQEHSSNDTETPNRNQQSNLFHGLFNIWSGFAGIITLIAGVLFIFQSITAGIWTTLLAVCLFLIGIHFDLDARFGKKSLLICPIIGVACVVIVIIIQHSLNVKEKLAEKWSEKDTVMINGKSIPLNSIKGAKAEAIKEITIPYSSLANLGTYDSAKQSVVTESDSMPITIKSSKPIYRSKRNKAANPNILPPFVGLKYIRVDTFTVSQHFSGTITLINSGGSPAYHFKTMVELQMYVMPPTERVPFGVDSKGHYPSDFTFANGTEVEIHPFSNYPINQYEYDEIISGRAKLYVRGIMRFDDVLGQPDTLTFCLIYRPELKNLAFCENENN